jgi:hypothetical protein
MKVFAVVTINVTDTLEKHNGNIYTSGCYEELMD